MKNSTAPAVDQQRLVRPVVHRDGRTGTCEMPSRKWQAYRITWSDGQTVEVMDLSYALASLTDTKRRFSPKLTPIIHKFA